MGVCLILIGLAADRTRNAWNRVMATCRDRNTDSSVCLRRSDDGFGRVREDARRFSPRLSSCSRSAKHEESPLVRIVPPRRAGSKEGDQVA